MEKDIAVLVVDDEAKILEVVESYVLREGWRALSASSGARALEILRAQRVSLVILDLMLPDISGEEVCRRIRLESSVPIIMMTAKSDEESVIAGLGLGADDYVTKPFSPRQLMARARAALRRAEAPSVPAKAGALRVDRERRAAIKGGRVLRLTPSEFKILDLLASSPERTFSRDEIIARAKADDFDGFDRTIDSHVKNLRQKIEDDPKSPRHVLTAHGFGYRYGSDE